MKYILAITVVLILLAGCSVKDPQPMTAEMLHNLGIQGNSPTMGSKYEDL